MMKETRARKQIVILDCCHSGAFMKGLKSTGRLAITDATFDANVAGRYVLTATDALQTAQDSVSPKQNLSQFTSWLVDGLAHGKASVDDKPITMDDLFQYVCLRAREDGNQTTPQRHVNDNTGDLVIAWKPTPPKPDFQKHCDQIADTTSNLNRLVLQAQAQAAQYQNYRLFPLSWAQPTLGSGPQGNHIGLSKLQEVRPIVEAILTSIDAMLELAQASETTPPAADFLGPGLSQYLSDAALGRLPMGRDVTDSVFASMGNSLGAAEAKLAEVSSVLEMGGEISNEDMIRIQQATAQVTICTQSMTALIENKKEAGKAIARNL